MAYTKLYNFHKINLQRSKLRRGEVVAFEERRKFAVGRWSGRSHCSFPARQRDTFNLAVCQQRRWVSAKISINCYTTELFGENAALLSYTPAHSYHSSVLHLFACFRRCVKNTLFRGARPLVLDCHCKTAVFLFLLIFCNSKHRIQTCCYLQQAK
jgi:hypothetical protein